ASGVGPRPEPAGRPTSGVGPRPEPAGPATGGPKPETRGPGAPRADALLFPPPKKPSWRALDRASRDRVEALARDYADFPGRDKASRRTVAALVAMARRAAAAELP